MKEGVKFKINTVGVVFLGGLILGHVLLGVLFPSFSYSLNKADQHKNKIEKYEIGNNKLLLVNPLFDYNYTSIDLDYKLSNNLNKKSGLILSKGYVSQFYPEGKVITSEEELRKYLFADNQTSVPNGTLFEKKDFVCFLSRGKCKPFFAANVFERMGFDWKKVRKVEDEEKADFPEDEVIILSDPHPDGVILETLKGNLFLVWKKERLPIARREILEKVWINYSSIIVDASRPKEIESCSFGLMKKGECGFDLNNSLTRGGGYVIKVNDEFYNKVSEMRAEFHTKGRLDWEVAKMSLSRAKREFNRKYSSAWFFSMLKN